MSLMLLQAFAAVLLQAQNHAVTIASHLRSLQEKEIVKYFGRVLNAVQSCKLHGADAAWGAMLRMQLHWVKPW